MRRVSRAAVCVSSYLTIAQQIQDYDSTNYPVIPPADPNGGGPFDYGTHQVGTTSDDVLSPSTAPVTITVADRRGFVAGATALIGHYGPTPAVNVEASHTITDVPDGTHITVQELSNAA